ncbi:MAG TPA: hypothetical protein PLI09_03340 [Candidatus Hydrogenedentes bacterium]|nr:hypothetical protein [Candidatus Hydrogenedentota bacterium]
MSNESVLVGLAGGYGQLGPDNNLSGNNQQHDITDLSSFLKLGLWLVSLCYKVYTCVGDKGGDEPLRPDKPDIIPFTELIKKVKNSKSNQKESYITVKNACIAPVVLLHKGWWEENAEKSPDNLYDRNRKLGGLHHWLINGFVEWGPSWDLFEGVISGERPYLFGQIANGDEANSIPLIVRKESIPNRLIDEYKSGKMSLTADITGKLMKRKELDSGIKKELSSAETGEKSPEDFFLVVDKTVQENARIDKPKDELEYFYTGYLWKCVVPESRYKDPQPLGPKDVYFVWEHTDFTKPDALKYNLDILDAKTEWIRKELVEPLVVLNKSHSIVRGESKWDTDVFYQHILRGH